MEFDKSAASPRPAYFGSSLEISRRRVTTFSRVTCLTNLQMIGFGPFVAFRAIHVQYCQLDSIGKNRSSILPICSIWRIEKFLDDPPSRVFYPTIASISLVSDPLQACRFSRFVLFGEWEILFGTRQVEFRLVRFDEWKLLCSI